MIRRPPGVETTYQIDWTDPKPRITEVSGDCPTCSLGPNSQVYYFDGANPQRPSREINGRGIVTEMTYDLNGQLTSKIEAFGTALEREMVWEYDANFPAFPTRIEQPSSTGNPLDLRITTFTYDPLTGDQESRSIEGIEDGSAFFYETTMTYNAAGQTESIDPPGHGTDDETSFTYDPARGNLVAADRTDPLIGTTTFGYDPFNRRTSVTDPNGVTTETVYDALNRVRFVTQKGASPSEDLVTEHRYTVFGDLFQTVLPEGNVIEYSYDFAGRLVAIERKPDDNPASHGERVFYELDDFGHRIREEQQRWDGGAWVVDAATEYEYSTRCHLERMIQGAGSAAESVTEYLYDCNGNLERVWDANHPSSGGVNPPTTTYSYDELDRLTSVTQPWWAGGSVVTGYAYDVQDHLISVTDGEGNTTSYTYSDRDLLTEENSPVSGITSYDYDEHGELFSETDARGVPVIRTVDALDRVTFVDYPDDTLDIVYTYDDPSVAFSKGRLTQILRDGHAVDYEYDRFGRTTRDGDLQILFDKNGNRVEIGYPSGVSALYTFDFADREKTLDVEIPGSGVEPWVTDSAYYASGPLQLLDFANGVQETRLHDQRYSTKDPQQ